MTYPVPPVISFWSWQLISAMLLNCFVSCILIGAYAARLAGAQSGRVATAISLFNLFVTVSRVATVLYTPMLGALSDRAAAYSLADHVLHSAATTNFQWQLRGIVFAGTLGAAIGTGLLPTFRTFFLRAVASFERSRSVPKMLLRLLTPRAVASLRRSVKLPARASLRRLSLHNIPKDLLLANIVVTGVYAIGILGASYASVINPGAARTALLSSGLINGIAMVCFTLIVDPGSALITDEAAKGERPLAEVESLVGYLSITTIVGMLLSQLALIPAGLAIAASAHFINGH